MYLYIYLFTHTHTYTHIRTCNTYIYTKNIFTNPSARAGYDTRSIFKRSLTGLNSEKNIF